MATSIFKEKDKNLPAKTDIYLMQSLDDTKCEAIKLIKTHDFDEAVGSGSAYLVSKVIKTPQYFIDFYKNKKTAKELEETYNTFNEICTEANKKTVFVPTLNTFCAFCNMTKTSLLQIAHENSDRGNVAQMIIEKLGDNIMQNMLSNKIAPVPGIFVSKANFGMRDNDAPQVAIMNVQNISTEVDDIMAEFKQNLNKI